MLGTAIIPKCYISNLPLVADLEIRQLRLVKQNFQQSFAFRF